MKDIQVYISKCLLRYYFTDFSRVFVQEKYLNTTIFSAVFFIIIWRYWFRPFVADDLNTLLLDTLHDQVAPDGLHPFLHELSTRFILYMLLWPKPLCPSEAK